MGPRDPLGRPAGITIGSTEDVAAPTPGSLAGIASAPGDGNRSVLGRLLEELSWVGPQIRNYRAGGQGYENVLTAEALQALDFLPRTRFLGPVIAAAHGADAARQQLVTEIEQAKLVLLPEEIVLGARSSAPVIVQPDGLLTSPRCYAMLEAKRIRSSSFQPQQLARELVAVIAEARGRAPLLLLLLGKEPPVQVQGHGRLTIDDAVRLHLRTVLDRCAPDLDHDGLLAAVPRTVAWITWQELQAVVSAQAESEPSEDPSTRASVARLAVAVTDAIDRHS